jgi:DNA helicase-2/ATP-dependent DNA helicase PcrA
MNDFFSPRPAQKKILSYQGGTLGVSAVPGSGKTWTLSLLAAELIRSKSISADQEVLVVTLVNSAAHNFSKRISEFLSQYGLIPSLGYRVRTLHGLAHDIVNQRPELAGLDSNFQIIDESEATRIREDAVYAWLKNNSSSLDEFLISDIPEYRLSDIRTTQIPILLNQISLQYIRTAKNLGLVPAVLENRIAQLPNAFPLVTFGLNVYQEYQKNLAFRGAVDFDDLIIKAHQILTLDDSLLTRLQSSWPYILEDEAQDSSLLQQRILALLAEQPSSRNWVRVGDPNQAIYETFTTADPQLLIDFIKQADHSIVLPNSGRSTESIIFIANSLVDWVIQDHPNANVKDALFPNYIVPTPPGDSQPNPVSKPGQIHLYDKALTPDEELQIIGRSVSRWHEENPDSTAAILAPRNERGKKIASVLRSDYGIEPVELLNSTLATRKVVGALVKIISALINPDASKKLSSAFLVYHREKRAEPELWKDIEELAKSINSLRKVESFLSPDPGQDWLDQLPDLNESSRSYLEKFKSSMVAWQRAAELPVDQLILTIGAEIFTDPPALSLAHQLATYEKRLSNSHPDWGLPELVDELSALARNERRFYSHEENLQFTPDDHKGKVVVTTAHKAKGLEWDRVYLISANNYNFPSGSDDDYFISEKWFIRDNLNLPAETLEFLEHLDHPDQPLPPVGDASAAARDEYVRERLRLFYVSITRAKKELIITWNTGRSGRNIPCEALSALFNYPSTHEDH